MGRNMLVDGSKSVEVSDDRITATGTYAVEQLTEEPVQEELSQAPAVDLVPPEALTFQYEPVRRVWVRPVLGTITGDTDPPAIRLEADSGGYTELRPQERSISADDSVAVQVDPDGDSVTVFAVNDGDDRRTRDSVRAHRRVV